jgi:Cof subfamily protein (haloacid dehalogenase superfamily)
MADLSQQLSQRSIKLVATDLDGTLVQPDGSLSPRTADALAGLAALDIELILATGRPPPFVLKLLDEIPTATEVVCANGAATLNPTSRELSHIVAIGDTLPHLIDDLSAAFPGIGFAAEWEMVFAYDEVFRKALKSDRMYSAGLETISEILSEPVFKILVAHPEIDGRDLYDNVNALIGHRAEPTHSGLGFVEIAALGVNKSAALARSCDDRGINAAEVIAFGDMPNDLSMLSWAGFGVAMANADSELKQVSDFVTLSNVDHGVAVVLETIIALVSQDD